jgi:hypothetical protein
MDEKNMKRRTFLKHTIVTPALCHFIGSSIALGMISKRAMAASGTPPRNFFSLWVQGGAWSTAFDYMPGVKHSISEGRLLNGRRATTFNQVTEGGDLRTNYVPLSVKAWGQQTTANLPPVWSTSVRLGDGSTVSLQSLLSGMAVFQGIRCPLDGHGIVDPHWYNPLGGLSLHGAIAAMSRKYGTPANSTPPAFSSLGDPKGFVDPEGQVNLEAENIRDLLEPTIRFAGKGQQSQMDNYMNRRQAMDATIKAALDVFGNYYANRLPGSAALFDARNQAETYLKKNFDSVFAYFDEAYERYKRVASDSTSMYNGSKIWIAEADRNKHIPSSRFESSHMHDPYAGSGPIKMGNTGSFEISNPGAGGDGGVKPFAMAETLFVHGLCCVYSGQISGGFTVGGSNHPGDPHYSGLIPLMIGSLAYQHQFAALLSEFKRVMTNRGLWEDTIVQFAGEFNRVPREDGTGADHGWEGAVSSIYSGAIDGFSAIGNLVQGNNTWGKAGLTDFGGESGGTEKRYLLLDDVIASIAHLCRLPRTDWPNPRAVSIFDAQGNKFQTSGRVSWSKIVA